MAQAWGQLIGSIANMTAGAIQENKTGKFNWDATRKMYDLQSAYWQNNTKWYNDNILAHAYKRTRQSLEEAGYNPLMGIGQPLAEQGPMPSSAIQEGHETSRSFGKLASAQEQNLLADSALKGAQIDETTSNARLLDQKKETEIQITNLKETENEIAKLEKKEKETGLKYYEKQLLTNLKNTYSQMTYNFAKTAEAQSNIFVNSAKEKEIISQTKYNNEKSRGYTSTWKIGPVTHSSTGNGIGHTEKKGHYETINGKKVWVRDF